LLASTLPLFLSWKKKNKFFFKLITTYKHLRFMRVFFLWTRERKKKFLLSYLAEQKQKEEERKSCDKQAFNNANKLFFFKKAFLQQEGFFSPQVLLAGLERYSVAYKIGLPHIICSIWLIMIQSELILNFFHNINLENQHSYFKFKYPLKQWFSTQIAPRPVYLKKNSTTHN